MQEPSPATDGADDGRGAVRADALAHSAARILDAVTDAHITLDRDFRIVYANAAAAAHLYRKATHEFLGHSHWDEWPASVGTPFEKNVLRAFTERQPARFIERYPVPGGHDVWLDVEVYPASEGDGGLHLVCRDVTERIERERRERFLSGLAERARALADDPDAVIADAVRSLGQFLKVSRCVYSDIDMASGTITVRRDYCADGVASTVGVYPISDYGEFLTAAFEAGRAVVQDDVQSAPLHTPHENLESFHAFDVRSRLVAPLVIANRLVAALGLHHTTPRRWLPEEAELVRTALERTWLTVEVARQHRAQRERADQEARVAEALARSLLIRPELTLFDGLEVCPFYAPSVSEERIGGDLYDAFTMDGGGVALVVGDVAGKGLAASAYVADIKYTLRAYLRFGIGGEVYVALRQMNRHVYERPVYEQPASEGAGHPLGGGKPTPTLVCLALAVLDPATGSARLGCGGMEPPLIWRAATGTVETVTKASGMILGADAAWKGNVVDVRLEEGDILVLYTDGLTEARPGRGSAFFGTERVAQALADAERSARVVPPQASPGAPPLVSVPLSSIGEAILGAAQAHAGGVLADDACLLLARRTTQKAPADPA